VQPKNSRSFDFTSLLAYAIADVPLGMTILWVGRIAASASAMTFSLRKEVIQPQVLLRLPCYDFTPIMNHTLDGCLSCELARRLLVQSTFVM
jgi:hypothetical protein